MRCNFSNNVGGLVEGRRLALPGSCGWEVEVAGLAWASVCGVEEKGFQNGMRSGKRVKGRFTMVDKANGRVIGRQA